MLRCDGRDEVGRGDSVRAGGVTATPPSAVRLSPSAPCSPGRSRGRARGRSRRAARRARGGPVHPRGGRGPDPGDGAVAHAVAVERARDERRPRRRGARERGVRFTAGARGRGGPRGVRDRPGPRRMGPGQDALAAARRRRRGARRAVARDARRSPPRQRRARRCPAPDRAPASRDALRPLRAPPAADARPLGRRGGRGRGGQPAHLRDRLAGRALAAAARADRDARSGGAAGARR